MHLPEELPQRLPRAVPQFLLSALLASASIRTANAHALPRQTKTIPHRELDVLPFPVPTADILPRQALNTVCGYIGGDPDVPATCSAGSHCAVDVEHGAVGCCPDGGPCTAGVYTGCVDRNSDPQTELNPYVYTCSGGDVCYQNAFDGGYFQYGCGSSSDMAATVVPTASGKEPLSLTRLSVDMTAEPTTLDEPTTLGTRITSEFESTSESSSESTATSETTTESSTEPSTESTTESTTESITESTTQEPTSTQTEESAEDDGAAAAPSSNARDSDHIGAIVGGTLGGVAFLAALVLLGLFLVRRRRTNARQGPGVNQDTTYISPMADGRHPFAPLPSVQEVDESQLPQEMPRAVGGNYFGDVSSESHLNEDPLAASISPYRSSSSTHGGAAVGGSGPYEADRWPLTNDPSGGYRPVADEFTRPEYGQPQDTQIEPQDHDQAYGAYPGPRRRDGGSFWQQNRRQPRNMNWL